METKEFVRKDLGTCGLKKYDGVKWCEMPEWYLEYLITDECNTSENNKMIARQELHQRRICDGQFEKQLDF